MSLSLSMCIQNNLLEVFAQLILIHCIAFLIWTMPLNDTKTLLIMQKNVVEQLDLLGTVIIVRHIVP